MPVTPAFMPGYHAHELQEAQRHSVYSGRAAELAVRSWLASQGRPSGPIDADVAGVDLIVDNSRRAQVKKIVRQRDGHHHFIFQGGPSSQRRQYGPEAIDLFFHVIITCYRQIIFETPASVIPLRDDGTFVHNIQLQLETDYHQRKLVSVDFKLYCVSQKLDPILFSSHQLSLL